MRRDRRLVETRQAGKPGVAEHPLASASGMTMLAAESLPFVLLDDARPGGAAARLYRQPRRVITASTADAVPAALQALRAARAEGRHVAGYLSYEAGAALQPRAPGLASDGPLLWFGVFDGFDELPADTVPALLPDPAGAWAGKPVPAIDRDDYDARLARLKALIDAGDIYQANLTYQASVAMLGDPLALYARLRATSRAGYGAIVATGAHMLLSLSPELFFALDGTGLTCRPMKGTAPRGGTPEEDRAHRRAARRRRQAARRKSDDRRPDAQRPVAGRGRWQRLGTGTVRRGDLSHRVADDINGHRHA